MIYEMYFMADYIYTERGIVKAAVGRGPNGILSLKQVQQYVAMGLEAEEEKKKREEEEKNKEKNKEKEKEKKKEKKKDKKKDKEGSKEDEDVTMAEPEAEAEVEIVVPPEALADKPSRAPVPAQGVPSGAKLRARGEKK